MGRIEVAQARVAFPRPAPVYSGQTEGEETRCSFDHPQPPDRSIVQDYEKQEEPSRRQHPTRRNLMAAEGEPSCDETHGEHSQPRVGDRAFPASPGRRVTFKMLGPARVDRLRGTAPGGF